MSRTVPPPDFHYVGLDPGPSRTGTAATATAVGATTFSAGVLVSGGLTDLPVLLASGIAGSVAAWLTARRVGFGAFPASATRASMGITPWGVVVTLATSTRVLRWAAVRGITVERVHEMDNATPSIRWSVVTVRTEREAYCGRTAGTVSLERLEANLHAYADEAARPPALDLEGLRPIARMAEPAFEQILAAARRRLTTGELLGGRAGSPSGYRRHGSNASRHDGSVLVDILSAAVETEADPRALAAVLAAETGVRDAAAALERLAASPHPLVACVARAAALRLGGARAAVGALDEVGEFLAEEDLALIEAWAIGDCAAQPTAGASPGHDCAAE